MQTILQADPAKIYNSFLTPLALPFCFEVGPAFCLRFIPTVVSQPYNAPEPNTKAAPTIIRLLIGFPKSQILRMKLTSFLTFSTIVTVTAEDFAPSKLTPVMQSSWVMELRPSMKTDLETLPKLDCNHGGMVVANVSGTTIGGEYCKRWNCVRKVPARGKNIGRLMKWL